LDFRPVCLWHGEQTVLNGVYDQEWPAWYAAYVIAHGLNKLLAQPLAVDQLGQFLAESNRRYEQTNKHQSWADFIKRELL